MNTIKSLFYLLLPAVLLVSCNDDDTVEQFTGEVTVTLINKGNTEATEGEATEFLYDVVLSKSFDTDISFKFSLDDISRYPDLLSIENPVTITKNTTKGLLKITTPTKKGSENQLSSTEKFQIRIASYTGVDNKIKLSGKEVITIRAEENFAPLTDQQKELLAHYKSQGLDLSVWMGRIPVEVTVEADGKGGFAPFDQAATKKYTGITYITLSEQATKEKPLLVMTRNAFGLSEYLQYVFRHETIENTGFWYNPGDEYVNPAAKAVLKALGSEKEQKWLNKEYPFNVRLDKLEFKKDKTITFVYENGAFDNPHKDGDPTGIQDDEYELITAVNFQYDFPLWDELLELVKGNTALYEHVTQGGSVHPDYYLNYSKIDEDDWSESNWVTPSSSYDNTEKVMSFKFNMDHNNAGDYDIITVKYTSPY